MFGRYQFDQKLVYFKSLVSDRAPTILSHDPPPTFRQKHVDTAGFGCQPGRHKISGNRVIGLGPSISVHVKELVRVVGSTTQIIYQFKMANSNLILEADIWQPVQLVLTLDASSARPLGVLLDSQSRSPFLVQDRREC